MQNRGSGNRNYEADYSANDWQGSASSEYDDDSTRKERKRWYKNDDEFDKYRRRDERPSSRGGIGTSSIFDTSSLGDVHDYDDIPDQPRRYDSKRGGRGFGREEGRRPSRRSYYEDRLIDVDRHGDDDDYVLSRRTGGGRDTSSTLTGGSQVVCVDGSRSSDRAVRFAIENVPNQRKLLLIHGIYSPLTSRVDDHEPELRRMEGKYLDMCRRAGRDCTFAPFEYSRNRSFSEGVCHFARANRSPSIIMGKREDVSSLRRSLMGSSTSMVMTDCEVPVTIALGKNSQQS